MLGSPLFWLALIGLLLALARAFQALQSRIDPVSFEQIALKICSEGRLDRLGKICHAAGSGTYVSAVASAVVAVSSRDLKDPHALLDVARDAYRKQFQTVRLALAGKVWFDVIAVLLACITGASWRKPRWIARVKCARHSLLRRASKKRVP